MFVGRLPSVGGQRHTMPLCALEWRLGLDPMDWYSECMKNVAHYNSFTAPLHVLMHLLEDHADNSDTNNNTLFS